MATDEQVEGAGFVLPEDTDWAADGAAAIRQNAHAAYNLAHGSGSTTVQIGTLTLPESPTEGQSVSVLADSSTVLPEGVTWDSGGEPTITERMLLVFVWSGTDWVGTYGLSIPAVVTPDPEDETYPTPGTLAASSITDTSFTLTVTGASDETALHAQPYAFSTDNGATYSAWQASNVYNATGLTAETEYTCRHRVRDAALNEATGSSITVETTADSSVVAYDSFDRADSVDSLGVADSGQTWVPNYRTPGISSGKAYSTQSNANAYLALGASEMEVECDVTYQTNTGLILRRAASSSYYRLTFTTTGLALYDYTTSLDSYLFTPEGGQVYNLRARVENDVITAYVDDVLAITYSGTLKWASDGYGWGIFVSNNAGRVDNFVARSV